VLLLECAAYAFTPLAINSGKAWVFTVFRILSGGGFATLNANVTPLIAKVRTRVVVSLRCHFIVRMIVLPRQARDKLAGKALKTETRFLVDVRAQGLACSNCGVFLVRTAGGVRCGGCLDDAYRPRRRR
jgi:hypothetical protein